MKYSLIAPWDFANVYAVLDLTKKGFLSGNATIFLILNDANCIVTTKKKYVYVCSSTFQLLIQISTSSINFLSVERH